MSMIKKMDDKSIKMRWATENLFLNPDSPLMCDKCHNRLGFLRMISHSVWVKKNKEYRVKCRVCGFVNKRIKGQIGMDIDREWDSIVFQKEGK